ncbi:peptidoglycan-binding protein [Streptomyces sp. NPDC017993]|uniref:peptidoglycan-binding protein n=1 Tax=Streptomyces sp. NPDC017993 TaxID=3365027 RepID=UPI00378B222E
MSTQEKTQDKYYTVAAGDTLSSIAERFGITVAQLAAWNHLTDQGMCTIGQRLIVSKSEQPGRSGYVTFPGPDWFTSMPNSPIILMMAYRLIDEGCSHYSDHAEGPSPRWDEQHRQSYAAWQRKLGFKGADADGIPGRKSWDQLRVPYPDESAG